MKKRILCLAIIFTIFAAWPLSVLADGKTKALSVKVGQYWPTGDINDLQLDGELYGGISFNLYLSSNYALEIGLGQFEAEETFDRYGPISLGPYREKVAISAIPLTISTKGLMHYKWGEIYFGAGLGLYFVDYHADINSSSLGPATFSDSDTVLGIQFIAGFLFNITETVYLGIESLFIITGEAEGSGVVYGTPVSIKGDLNGITLSGLVGLRF